MICTDFKSWTVYDAKNRKILDLSHDEFKNLLQTQPIKLAGRKISIQGEMIWVDALLHSENLNS